MRYIVFILLMVMAGSALAQKSPVDKLFEKYSGKEGYTSVYISEYMFTLFSNIENNDKEFNNVVRGLTGIKILATETPEIGVNFHEEIMKDFSKKDYKELMVVKEQDQHLTFLIKDVGGKIVELLLIVGGSDNVLISIEGNDIDLKTISGLSKSMNIDALEALDKME
ncbi:MAG: DUF4252 domain-containing protein [Bacteroidales bacterium]